ncbi:hypothetical protein [uncultured Tateyamaria sp.]|uniref:hypothetical protein n=1 Tax=uncultured Tateyamaria sp. TaxID=455651 RepID=UPI00261817EF|nr:hypothetical protein [uncultured Tateyamaria sp.]
MDEEYIPENVAHPDVYRAALDVLSDANEFNAMTVSDLMDAIVEELPEHPKSYLIYRDINASAQDPLSRIRSRKGRNGGYFLVAATLQPTEPNLPTKQEADQEKTYERHLWPLVAMWLREVKQLNSATHEIANLKKGGVWSNPDVVGLTPIEELGFFDVEITTVEVKPSLHQWRYFFFEAVSHKRFSERVYFVYKTEEHDPKETEELRRYAEKHNVGLVELQLSDDDHKKLTKWSKLKDSEKSALLEYFVEIMPAPFEAISVRDKVSFLKQMGVSSKKELYSFGIGD